MTARLVELSLFSPRTHAPAVANCIKISKAKFNGDGSVEEYIRAKRLICQQPADLIAILVLGLEGKARDWWNSIPCNFTGDLQGLTSFLCPIRRAFPTITTDRHANCQLSQLKLELVEGSWTPFRCQFCRYIVQLNIPDSYALTILSNKIPVLLNVY